MAAAAERRLVSLGRTARRAVAHGCRFFVVGAVLVAAGSPTTAWAQIRWRSGTSELSGQAKAEVVSTIASRGVPGADRHLVIQFDEPVTPALRAELAPAGLTLLRYLGDSAFFAAVTPDGADPMILADVTSLIDAQEIHRDWKLHPDLVNDIVAEWAIVDSREAQHATTPATQYRDPIVAAYILFHRDVDLDSEASPLVGTYDARIRSELRSINGLVIELPFSMIKPLAMEDAVEWIEPPLPGMTPINDGNRARTGADVVQAPPYNLDGSGVTVLVYDGGSVRASHVDFQGRLTAMDSTSVSDHATHVSGTVGGAGVANALYKGMAPGVTILSYGLEVALEPGFLYTDPGDLEADYFAAIGLGADVSNNSIGTNTAPNGFDCTWEGNYSVTSQLIDTIVRGDASNPLFNEPFRIVWANGNERGSGRCGENYHTTAPPACAKNHLTVGAVDSDDDSMSSFSSWGPCDDDRLKPDIVGPGVSVMSCSSSSDTAYGTKSGTSMSSPTVCGLSALLLEDYRAFHPGEPDFRNSMLRACFAHTAVDLGSPGPDYKYGYGSVRIQPAVELMRAENFLEDSVDHGEVFSALVTVSAGDGPLKVTMAWDDVPGAANTAPELVNDLDLRVFDVSSNRYYPWTLGGDANPSAPAVRNQEDHINNIEQVMINNPNPGVYRVEVYGFNVPEGPQPFSLCASPQLVACSSTGVIGLSAPLYNCAATADIQVVDCDLNTDDGTVQTVTVTIASDSEPGGETVLLTETAAETADFRGTIPFDVSDGPGVLQVAQGDTITATYVDADDGQGGVNVVVTATAGVDCQGPVISNVAIPSIGSQTATVTFDTDEPAVGTVRFGLSCASLTESATESSAETAHSVFLTGLDFNTEYFLAVDAVDNQGNASTDDNGGNCYSFSTPNVAYNFTLNSDPGWTTEGQWAFGEPTGGGSANGDPTSGHTGANVYGYNLFGDYADDLPATYLTTTAIDCLGLTDVNLSFWRWLGVESNSNFDEATIEVSNNGASWTVIWRATDTGADVSDSAWQLQEFDISSIADNQPNVFIRWAMGPTDPNTTFPGWNIDDVQIIANGGSVAMGFPDGLPELFPPGEPVDITVRIVEGDESYIEDSATLYHRYDGGAFVSSALQPLGGELYLATLPAAACSAVPEFYFSAEGSDSGVIFQPPAAPADTFTAEVGAFDLAVMDDDFETDQGWTVTNSGGLVDGPWERGVPINCSRGDPPSDSDGSSRCYLTDNSSADGCNSDVDGGYTWLISPTMDLSGGDARIEFDLWYTNDYGADPNNDLFVVWVSNNNGGSWTEVETVGPGTGSGWATHSFSVGDFVAPSAQVKVRFEASDLAAGSVVEAGIDAFSVVGFECVPTEATCDDGIQNQGEDRIDCGGPCTACECTSDGACEDGQYCTGDETCDAYGACQSSGDPCADPNFPHCNEGGQSCDECTTGLHCDDEVACTVDDCQSGACMNTADNGLCDDGDLCTTDTCDAVTGCANEYHGRPFGDLVHWFAWEPGAPRQPDLDDLLCMLDDFANGEAPDLCPGSDLAPCGGNSIVDATDIIYLLEAFSGNFLCTPACPP